MYHTVGKYCLWYFIIDYSPDLILGFEKISSGKLAATIPWMLQTHNISFYFKVQNLATQSGCVKLHLFLFKGSHPLQGK